MNDEKEVMITRKRHYEYEDSDDAKRRNRLRTELRFDFVEK
jgi:hypothetical protein